MGVCLLCTVLFVAALGQIAQVQSVSVPAASPASRLSGLVTAASLFPRIPGSFTNRVNNAAVDWNIVSLAALQIIAPPTNGRHSILLRCLSRRDNSCRKVAYSRWSILFQRARSNNVCRFVYQALQWSLRNRSDTNVAPRVIALQSVSVWKALQANAMQDDPLNETAIVGEYSQRTGHHAELQQCVCFRFLRLQINWISQIMTCCYI